MVALTARPRIFALLLVSLLLAGAWIPVAQSQSQLPQFIDISVLRGGVVIRAGGHNVNFLDENETATLNVTIQNNGSAEATNIPLYWHLSDAQKGCRVLPRVPAQSNNVPGVTWFTTVITATEDLAKIGHNITIVVNEAAPAFMGITDACASAKTEIATNTGDRIGWGYFVKGLRPNLTVTALDWCREASAGGCETDMYDHGEGEYWNVTAYDDNGNGVADDDSTYFRVTVANEGDWKLLTNYSSSDCTNDPADRFKPSGCPDFDIDYQVRARGPGIGDPNGEVVEMDPVDSSTFEGITLGWTLVGRKGTYAVTASVNPAGTQIRETKTLDNQLIREDIEVRYVDLRASINATDFKTTSADPYAFVANTRVNGMVQFHNDGIADAVKRSSTKTITYTTYVDTPGKFAATNTVDTFAAGTTINAPVDFRFTTDSADADRYLSPGKHTLFARIDPGSIWNETDETNNLATLDFYIADDSAPIFSSRTDNPYIVISKPGAGPTSPSDRVLRPAEAFNIHAYVNDTDIENLKVFAQLSPDANASHVINISLSRTVPASDPSRFSASQIRNLTFADIPNGANLSEQNWTLRVNATDATGNSALSREFKFKLEKWPLHTLPEDDIVLGQARNRSIGYSSSANPYYELYLLDYMTGIADQWNQSSNLKLIVDPPGNDSDGRIFEITAWENNNRTCTRTNNSGVADDLGLGGGGELICPGYGKLNASFGKADPGRPGVWNATIIIKDISGANRTIHRQFTVLDELPKFLDFKLTRSVAAGENLRLEANVSDDFDVGATYVNFTRSDGKWRNITLTANDSTADGGVARYHYLQNLTTGRGQILGLAGSFNVTLDSMDINGNWNRSQIHQVTINDSERPSVTQAGTRPTEQEIGEPIEFFAVATDETNLTVRLEVTRSGEVVYEALLNATGGNNYSHVTNFSTQGTYNWRIIAYDSNVIPLDSPEKRGAFGIRDNLGPRFDIKAPSFISAGQRYGTGAPRIEVVVYDSDGVDRESINLTLEGARITEPSLVVTDAPAGVNGYTLTYSLPAASKFSHNDTVTIGLAALDNSDKHLIGTHTFTFRVDDSPPTSRVVSFEPRYLDTPNGLYWNVSLDTEFVFAATDTDGMPTGVETIRYQIVGGGSDQQTVYTGPFRLTDIPNAYTGPKTYLIQFFAEDDVGNRESPRQQIAVYVDDTAPVLDPFGSLPQGRYVNATFIDDRSGVARAVVWQRVNDGPYAPITLELDDGVWRAVLAEGKKGDRISYYLQAWDHVDNTETAGNETEPYSTYTVGNHLPSLRLTNPLLGSRVSKIVDIKWAANDEDGDPLSFLLYLKAPGRDKFVELASIDVSDRRSYALDTSRYADGQYTLAITANDGSFVARAETTVTFINSGTAVGNVTAPSSRVAPNEAVLLTAEVRKSQATVEARLYRDGEFVDAFPMNDQGRDGDLVANDGIYSVEVSVGRSGNYQVEIVTLYEEGGEMKESRDQNAAAFTVRLTPGNVLSEYALLWVAIVVLALAGVGVAGFALYRKWR